MQYDVKDTSGDVVGSVTLNESVWCAPSNDSLLHQAVVAQMANRRQGTHESQTRGQVSYSTRKLRQQKHSGSARLGSRRSPTLVGGGTIFGPHARSHRKGLPKKMRRSALRVALSEKVREQRLIVLDEFVLDQPRTQEIAALVQNLGCVGRTLLVTDQYDGNIVRSAKGLPRVDVLVADMLNPVVATETANMVVTRGALNRIDELWARGSAEDAE